MTRLWPDSHRALEHVERGHHRDRDAGDPRVGVAGLEGIDGLSLPRHADVRLDALNDLRRGQRRGRLGRGAAAATQWSDAHRSTITNVVSAPETVFVTAAWYTSAGLEKWKLGRRTRWLTGSWPVRRAHTSSGSDS